MTNAAAMTPYLTGNGQTVTVLQLTAGEWQVRLDRDEIVHRGQHDDAWAAARALTHGQAKYTEVYPCTNGGPFLSWRPLGYDESDVYQEHLAVDAADV